MSLLINGEYVDDSIIRQEFLALRPRMLEAMPEEDPLTVEMRAREWAQENVIERVLLRQAAMAGPPCSPEELDTAIREVRTGGVLPGNDEQLAREVEIRLRTEKLVAKLTAAIAKPKKNEVSEYYRHNRDHFYVPETIQAGHIVKDIDEQCKESEALAAIRQAQEELRRGRAFEEIADEFSDCPGRGGDLGTFPRGHMVEEFDAVVFALDAGETSDIFRTPFGFHIAKVYAKVPERVRSLSEVRDELESMMHAQKREQAMEAFVDAMRAKADIRKATRQETG